MTTIKCPKCGKHITIDISKAINKNGEVYVCKYCNSKFRYTEK